MPLVRSILIPFLVPILAALGGCGGESPAGDASAAATAADGAPTFRVRSDFDAPLNADAGWAGAPGEAVTVHADQPFRVRFEAEAASKAAVEAGEGAATPLRLALQYRRNEGEWTDVEAHDFPYPTRELEIDFATDAIGTLPPGWSLAGEADRDAGAAGAAGDAGAAGTLAVATVADVQALRARAGDAPLIALYPPPWNLADAFSFAIGFRLASGARSGVVADAEAEAKAEAKAEAGADAGFALLFGYVDSNNHLRATLDPRGMIRIGRVVDGEETILDERPAAVVAGRWQEIEIQYENRTLDVNFEDDTLEYEVPIEGSVPAEELGFRVPAGGDLAIRAVLIEGEPQSPRVSAVATAAYENRAATADLLPGSAAKFVAGEGISLEERTAPWPVASTEPGAEPGAATAAHGEFEWALVIRRFADGAVTNETGDRFEFRLVAADAEPQSGPGIDPAAPMAKDMLRAPTAAVTLRIPDGHLGGTFVETPGRIGPWQASNGDLYFIMEPAESDNLFMMMKSTDGGRSWREVDGPNRPQTGDLESVDGRMVDGTIHILHQVTESTRYHAFRTSDHPSAPDSWLRTDELATTVSAIAQMATVVVRSDGSIVTVHLGDTLGYSIRSPEGDWSEEILIEDGTGERLAGPQAVLGRDDSVHLAYFREDGTLHHRQLLTDGTLTPAVELAEGVGTSRAVYGAVLPLVYQPETDTLVVAYRRDDGQLRERRIVGDAAPTAPRQITDRPVITNAVDAQQPAADLIGDGSTVHALFIDTETRSIHHSCNDLEADGGWQPPTVAVDDILGTWVRGGVLENDDGEKVLGFVYDAGSYGGAGMNRYGELPLGVCGRGSDD